MADYYLGGNRGITENPGNLTINTTTNATDFEIHISTTNNPTKKDVIQFLRNAEQYIIGNGLMDGQTGVDLPPL